MAKDLRAPMAIAGIRNFGWVEPGVLARGEQPLLEEATFTGLRELGIRTIVSLRPDREPPPKVSRRNWPEYRVTDEYRLVEAAGLRFRHVPMADFSAPAADEIAAALGTVEAEVVEGPGVYVHCRAGAGRTSLVTGAWMVSRGHSGDDAARMYEQYMAHVTLPLDMSPSERAAVLKRVGQPAVWWALREIVAALGSPVTYDPPFLLPPERPAHADDYRAALRPWRAAHNGRP